jgi:hypothetical protein
MWPAFRLQVAVCAGLGSAVGYGYLQLLMRDVDTFRQDDPIAAAFLMAEDSRLEFAALRQASSESALDNISSMPLKRARRRLCSTSSCMRQVTSLVGKTQQALHEDTC